MTTMRVQTDAGRTDRGIGRRDDQPRRLRVDPQLLLWRRMINQAVTEAKKMVNGLPTDRAILAQWWIADHRPTQADKDEWERSFACACHWLGMDVDAERKRLVAEIELAQRSACYDHLRKVTYRHRAAVLACAGEAVAIARQYVLPLVSPDLFDEVAGNDGDD